MQLVWQLLDPADAAHRAALASLYPPDSHGPGAQADGPAGLNQLLASAGICGLLGWEALDGQAPNRDAPARAARRALFFCLARQSGPVCDIIELASDAAFRRRGIALCGLARFCLHIAHQQPAAEIFLEVAEDNLAARNLYQKAGFAEQARRPDYYRRKEGRVDALLLCWQAGCGMAHIESLAKGC